MAPFRRNPWMGRVEPRRGRGRLALDLEPQALSRRSLHPLNRHRLAVARTDQPQDLDPPPEIGPRGVGCVERVPPGIQLRVEPGPEGTAADDPPVCRRDFSRPRRRPRAHRWRRVETSGDGGDRRGGRWSRRMGRRPRRRMGAGRARRGRRTGDQYGQGAQSDHYGQHRSLRPGGRLGSHRRSPLPLHLTRIRSSPMTGEWTTGTKGAKHGNVH
jgi:hypothetical protein